MEWSPKGSRTVATPSGDLCVGRCRLDDVTAVDWTYHSGKLTREESVIVEVYQARGKNNNQYIYVHLKVVFVW